MMSRKVKTAIIGSGNIGTDLLIKIMRTSEVLEASVLVGIDPASDGLARAARLGVATTAEGMSGLIAMDEWHRIDIVFDATSAGAHKAHSDVVTTAGKVMIDLTPAALGPYTVPVVNGDAHLDAPNVNMVTCGGQATIPIVAAISSVAQVHYAFKYAKSRYVHRIVGAVAFKLDLLFQAIAGNISANPLNHILDRFLDVRFVRAAR